MRSMRITIDVETERQVTDMAIKGAVLGDILGAQYEFDRPKDLDWKNVPLLSDQGVGFTDDSVMSLAIKKALVEGKDLGDNGRCWQRVSFLWIWRKVL